MTLNPSRSTVIILLLWAAITALDLNKAYHIDDTFHLKAAQWIGQHPLEPMSGYVNWGHDPEPIHHFNQPPGFFYLVAATGHLFGWGEMPMHAMRSLFTLLALCCFHGLALRMAPSQALWLTALFALCPAFMVNQGLMTDVPLLALQLLFFYLLLVPGRMAQGRRLACAALVLTAALFIKYTTLPLLLVFPIAMLLRKQWHWLPLALVPLLALVLWSGWNLQEYGGVHIMDREGNHSGSFGIVKRVFGMLLCIGALTPFIPAFLHPLPGRFGKNLFVAWCAALVVGLAFAGGVYMGLFQESMSDHVLRVAFMLNGLLLPVLCARYLPWRTPSAATDQWILALWALGLAAFLALFSPMMASRHILLILAPVLLILAPALAQASTREKALALTCTAALGVALTLSDKQYAAFYRTSAPRIQQELAGKGTIWSLGHWGWQWYAEQAGMQTYGRTSSPVAVGDYLVVPADYDQQDLSPNIVAVPVRTWDEPPGPLNFFCVEQYAGMYTSSFGKLPWNLCRTHHKIITAYRITALTE